MKLQLAHSAALALLVLQADGAAIPTGLTKLTGSFDHPDPSDGLGWIGNHVVQHHIRDLCYHNGIQDMPRYKIVDLVGKTIEDGWRDFFLSVNDAGTLETISGLPAVGTAVMSAVQQTNAPGRLTITLQGDVEDKIEASDLLINSKPAQRISIVFTAGVTTAVYAIPMLRLTPHQTYYLRFVNKA